MERKGSGRARLCLWSGWAMMAGITAWPVKAQQPVASDIPAASSLPPAADDPFADIPNLEITYYDVSGKSAAAIRKAINAVRPRDPNDGESVDALARWQIGWRWPRTAGGGCDLNRATLEFSATIRLPRLVETPGTSKSVMKRWNDYIDALKRHEATHIRTAWSNSDRVLAAIRASDCANASEAGKAAVAEIGRLDVEYDRVTKHGRTEGATFP